MEEKNNLGINPLGENPFGEGFVPENSFGNANAESTMGNQEDGGDGDAKVCPHCGTKLEGDDTYCMLCGMTVAPVMKKDYDKAMNEGNGGYGGNPYGGNSYGGNSYGGPGGASNRPAGPTPVIKEESPVAKIFVAAIAVIALIAAVFFIYKGVSAATAEQTVRMTMNGVSGNASIKETVTLYSKGDKLKRALDEVEWDVSSYDKRTIDMTKQLLDKQYEEYAKLDFVTYEVTQVGNTVYFKLDYNYLDVVKNMQIMMEKKMLSFANKKDEVTYKDYISLKNTIRVLENMGYKKE